MIHRSEQVFIVSDAIAVSEKNLLGVLLQSDELAF